MGVVVRAGVARGEAGGIGEVTAGVAITGVVTVGVGCGARAAAGSRGRSSHMSTSLPGSGNRFSETTTLGASASIDDDAAGGALRIGIDMIGDPIGSESPYRRHPGHGCHRDHHASRSGSLGPVIVVARDLPPNPYRERAGCLPPASFTTVLPVIAPPLPLG